MNNDTVVLAGAIMELAELEPLKVCLCFIVLQRFVWKKVRIRTCYSLRDFSPREIFFCRVILLVKLESEQ